MHEATHHYKRHLMLILQQGPRAHLRMCLCRLAVEMVEVARAAATAEAATAAVKGVAMEAAAAGWRALC